MVKAVVLTTLTTPNSPWSGGLAGWAGEGAVPVVKLHTKLLTRALPARSLTPVVIVAVYTVLGARLLDGVKVAVTPA